MAIDTAQLETDLEYMIADMPITFYIGTSSFSGSKSKIDNEKVYSEYGSLDDYKFSITAVKSDFTGIPEIKSIIIYEGTAYRVLGTEISSDGIAIRFDLGALYHG